MSVGLGAWVTEGECSSSRPSPSESATHWSRNIPVALTDTPLFVGGFLYVPVRTTPGYCEVRICTYPNETWTLSRTILISRPGSARRRHTEPFPRLDQDELVARIAALRAGALECPQFGCRLVF